MTKQELKDDWKKFVEDSDVESLLGLYKRDALLKPTLSATIRKGHDEIRPYFEGGGEDPGFVKSIRKVSYLGFERRDLTGCQVEVGTYEFEKTTGETVRADYTFVFSQDSESGELRIQAHHSSLTFEG